MIRLSLLAAATATLLACQAPAAPAPGTPSQTPILETPSAHGAEAPTKTAPVHGAEAEAPRGVMTTNRPADPNRIPNDAIHAAYRKSPKRAGGQLPSGHPPVPTGATPHAPFAPKVAAGETGVALPLPLEGSGSIDELKRRLAKISDAATRTKLEEAFRLTFTLERAKRNPNRAAELLGPLTGDAIAGATASRILGYVAVSRGFDFEGAMKHYGDAVKKDADYGEAHYALAFMHVRGDKTIGRGHFERALALGVPDTRGIARFYPDAPVDRAKQAVDPTP
ncbi:MAG: hypothetical protein QF464_03220 [Myxococcota bacterium]|nr:hypothetical protein [Myxococcota bacterium]